MGSEEQVKGFLTARFMQPSNDIFENSEVYRLKYDYDGKGIEIEDSFGEKLYYERLDLFKYEWSMNDIPERHKANNPDFSENK